MPSRGGGTALKQAEAVSLKLANPFDRYEFFGSLPSASESSGLKGILLVSALKQSHSWVPLIVAPGR